MTLRACPASIRPQVTRSPARASTRRASSGGQLGGELGGGRHQVGGQVRAGGVPAGAVEGDLQPVAGRGDRAGPQPDPADVDPRVAVHGEDPAHAVQDPGLDGVERAAGQDLLGGLEQQPHRARQQPLPVELGQHQPGAEHDSWCARRARRRARGPGTVERYGDALLVSGMGRASMSARSASMRPVAVPGADVADQSGAAGQHAWAAGRPAPAGP